MPEPGAVRPSQRQRRRDELAFVRSVLRGYLSAESGPVGTYPLRTITYRNPRNPVAVAMVSRGEVALSPSAHRLLGELVGKPPAGVEPAHHQWSPRAWAAAKDVVTTLTHEAIHFVDENPRDPRVAEDAVVRSRGIRALEEGATELQTHRRDGHVVDQLHSDGWLDYAAHAELQTAASAPIATPQFVAGVREFLLRSTEGPGEFAAVIDKLNRVDAPDKPGVLADVLLDKSDLGDLVTEQTRTQIRTEVAAAIVRDFDDVTDRKRPPPGYITGKRAATEAVDRAGDIVRRYQSIGRDHHRIGADVAQAHARFAQAELDTAHTRSARADPSAGLASAHAELAETLSDAAHQRERLAEQLTDLTHELGAAGLQHHWDQHAAAAERSQVLVPTTFDEASAATQMENYAGLQQIEHQRLATNADNADRGGQPPVPDERFRPIDPDQLPRDPAALRADGHARLAAAQAAATSPPRADLTGAGPTQVYVPGDQQATPTDGLRRTGPSPPGTAWAGVAPPGSRTRAGGIPSARPNRPGPRSRRPKGHER